MAQVILLAAGLARLTDDDQTARTVVGIALQTGVRVYRTPRRAVGSQVPRKRETKPGEHVPSSPPAPNTPASGG